MRNPRDLTKKFQEAMYFLEGSLDHVLLCHGMVVTKGILNCKIPSYDQTMLVNVRSMVHLTSLSVPYLKKSESVRSPSITILTSNQGSYPDPESPLMSISASMVQMMIKTVALETAYFGVRVNGVAVGVTKTAARTKEDDIGLGMTPMDNRKFLFEA